jgi:alkylhydroperoxidase family enzyme
MTEARIPVPDPADLRPDVAELLALIAPEGREPARTMAVLARQPDLLSPFLGWAAALALQGVLSHRDHELLALRVACNCGSDFEWGEHVEYARAAGIADDEIASVARGDGTWAPHEAALLRAADELHRDQRVDDGTWSRLSAAFGTDALVEIVFVVGQYTMLSMVANTAGIDPPEGLQRLPEST